MLSGRYRYEKEMQGQKSLPGPMGRRLSSQHRVGKKNIEQFTLQGIGPSILLWGPKKSLPESLTRRAASADGLQVVLAKLRRSFIRIRVTVALPVGIVTRTSSSRLSQASSSLGWVTAGGGCA